MDRGSSFFIPDGLDDFWVPTWAPRGRTTPRSFANLTNWWDADDSSTITIATGVSAWTDKQQGIVVSQATGTKQPARATGVAALNNRAVIQFDGIDDIVTSSSGSVDFSNSEETLILVGKFPASSTVKYVMRKVAGDLNEFAFFRNTTGNFRRGDSSNGAGAITAWTWDTTSYHILVIRRKLNDGAVAIGVWEGGGSSRKTATHTVSSTETGDLYFGGVAGALFYDCQLAEIIRYSRKLSFTEIDSLCLNYLVPKWGAGAGEPSWTKMAA